MEQVFEHKRYRCLYTKNIDLNKYFAKYTEEVGPFFKIRKKGEGLKFLLGIDNDEEYAILKQTMDPNKGKNTLIPKAFVPRRRFLESWPHYEIPEHESMLTTLNTLRKETRDEKYKRMKCVRYYGKIVLEVEKNPEDAKRPRSLHPVKDYLVCVRVESLLDIPGCKGYSPSQEFWVPGGLSLEKIKDRITCQDDFQFAYPVVENPLERNTQRKMDLNKNGMFYIGENFYIDNRWGCDKDHADYSIEVREWMKSKNINPGNVYDMQKFQLKDLTFRLGYHYLYMHQGKCEHLITFTDARLIKHKEDLLFIEDYPLLKTFASLRARYCVLCLSRLAKLIVMGCDIIPYDKGFICNTCALSYLYDNEGNKKTEFTLYRYVDRSAII